MPTVVIRKGEQHQMRVKLPFLEYFSSLEDHRIERRKLYSLEEILLITLCGTICGADSWRDIVSFGKEKIEFLRKYLPHKNGVPCKNTFARFFASLDEKKFREIFTQWVNSFNISNKSVAIDGKCLRRSHDKKNNKSAIHMVSAFAAEARLVLGQIKVDDKSNEITAIPKLLDLLDIKRQTVTIDAMGCQKKIANKIISKGGDYILSLKENHPKFHKEVCEVFETKTPLKEPNLAFDYFEDNDKGHGRIENRKCYVCSDIDVLSQWPKWNGLKSVVMMDSTRETGDKIEQEKRVFISSLDCSAEVIAKKIRGHWSIENNLHWSLDVVFNEDSSRIRDKNAAQNMATIRHCAKNLLEKAKSFYKDISLKGLRKKAGWGNKTLGYILEHSPC